MTIKNILIKLIALCFFSLSAFADQDTWRNAYKSLQHQKTYEAIALLYAEAAQYEPAPFTIDGEVYFRLMQLSYKVGDTDAAKEALLEFEKFESQLSDSARSWLTLARANRWLAEVNAQQAKIELETLSPADIQHNAMIRLQYHYLTGHQRSLSSLYDEAIAEFTKAQALAIQLGDSHAEMGILTQMVNIQYYMRQFEESLATNESMAKQAAQYQDDFFRIFSYSNAMNIYYMLATEQQAKASEAATEADQQKAEAEQKRYTELSREYRDKVFAQAEGVGAYKSYLRALIQLQNQHLREEQMAQAVSSAQRTIEVAERHNSPYEKAVSYNNMAIALRSMERYEAALAALEKADEIYTQMQHKQSMLWALEDYSIVYELMGDYQKSLEYFKRYHDDSMALVRQTNSDKVLELQKVYETDKNKREIERLNQQNLLNASEIKLQRIMIFSGAALAAIIVVGMFYFIQRNKVIAQANKKLDQLNNELKEQALRDPLTKLHNRRFVNEIQEKITATVVRRKSSELDDKKRIGLVLLDIDHFKSINDNFGHDVGDRVLIDMASQLQQSLRKGDFAVRWGGEEFLVMLFDTNQEGVDLFCERMLALINSTPMNMGQESKLVTLSMGYALFPFSEQDPHWLSWDESLKLVDRLLYIAKEKGRNRAVAITMDDENLSAERKKLLLDLTSHVSDETLRQHGLSMSLMSV